MCKADCIQNLYEWLCHIWLLTFMSFPCTVSQFKIGKCGFERRVFWAACVNSKMYRISNLEHMADSHLMKMNSVKRVLDTKIIISAAETEPNRFKGSVYIYRCPIGVAIVGYNTAKSLDLLVFIFNGCFQPAVTILIQDDPTLVISFFCFKCGFYNKGEIFV